MENMLFMTGLSDVVGSDFVIWKESLRKALPHILDPSFDLYLTTPVPLTIQKAL
tara:strand:- start:13 stop:174 length:162 start_codon:yes stop_codon:yes gene_type:complete